MNVWAASFVVWLVLQIVAICCCSGWRSEWWMYGFAPIGLLLWMALDMFFSSDTREVGQIIVVYGFAIAAIYLTGLLIAELIGRLKERKLAAKS